MELFIFLKIHFCNQKIISNSTAVSSGLKKSKLVSAYTKLTKYVSIQIYISSMKLETLNLK